MTYADADSPLILATLAHRAKHGSHLHHSACIHNLPPEEQVELRGKSVEWWRAWVGDLPEQIAPDQWECEPPTFAGRHYVVTVREDES